MSFEKILVLGKMLPAFNKFITVWTHLQDSKPHLQPLIDEGLKWVLKYYEKAKKNNTYIISMGNLCITQFLYLFLNSYL